ncbi:intraflagellar transport protein 122 [Trypanosoma brucei equiperdum]|uniref:Intraflagellar transport protein 122 homolog n=1 Tax=Trypanosoma brucei equiperdum TaxID=630700 RepID=A0A3L6KWV8_9TRYP|nr:intraflagellar transport protein 122 [Trypanosoma brucei equiperdum]
MLNTVKWAEHSGAEDEPNPPVYSLSYHPSGETIVAGCGVRVVVFDATTGAVRLSLKGHTDAVYTVTCFSDGKYFASGGADKTVILWTIDGEGVLKYQHRESVQALAHNPVTGGLVSVAGRDYGTWSAEQMKVGKSSLPAKGLCCAWSRNGQTLAIGLSDGSIIFVPSQGGEKVTVKRTAPVWAVVFSPISESGADVLVVGSCDRRLSFYTSDGKPASKEKEISCEPCSLSFYGGGKFLLVGGSNCEVSLFTKDGNLLVKVADADDCIWSVQASPKHQQLCCGTNSGVLKVVDINIPVVHSIFNDQFVFRDKMSDAVVHQLTLDKRLRIPCNGYIIKLAVYRDRVAVQLCDKFIVFELFYDDERKMKFQNVAIIRKRVSCDHLCVTFNGLVICCDRRLTMYDFQGNMRQEWTVESSVCCIKVIGGVEGRECLLLGLKNGLTLRMFVDNPFPTTLAKVNNSVKALDLSCDKTKLAVVDDNGLLQAFDLRNKNEVLFMANGVQAVAWNSEYDDMICYTTAVNTLNIKTGALPPHEQRLPGYVIGFKANRVFNVCGTIVDKIEVPHSQSLYRYIEKRDFESAHRIARLGVPDGDWKMLGMHAMMHLQLDVARKAFINIREVKLVELLNRLEMQQRLKGSKGEEDDGLLMGDIFAFQGKYQEASRHFLKAGHENKAIDMFCDLKMWTDAQRVCSNESHLKELIRQQARWAEDSENYIEAAALFQACGDKSRAIAMLCNAGDADKLMEMCRAMSKSEVALITECANYFKKQKLMQPAMYAYEKVGDYRSLICLHMEMKEWRKAFALLDLYPQYIREVYVPWANWLADNGNFTAALDAYRKAKWPREAVRMMESLAANSVICRRFQEAAFYFIHLAGEYGVLEDDQQLTEAEWAVRMKRSAECVRRAEIYYAYHFVYLHVTQPFTYDEVTLFNASRFVIAMTSNTTVPLNVGRGEVLYTLAHIASQLDMTRTARMAFERLHNVVLPTKVMEQIDVDSLVLRSKGFNDNEDLLDVCFRCKQIVQQFANAGDRCPTCAHPFVRSFVTFVNLPLVEFTLSNELSDTEAERIILTGAGRKNTENKTDGNNGEYNGWKADTGADVITFAEEEDNIDALMDHQLAALGRGGAMGTDPFSAQLKYILRPGRTNKGYQPFVVNADMLCRMRRDEVFIVKAGFGKLPVQNKYYRLVNRSVGIILCPGCQHFFKDDDYEYECMKGNGCPLCQYRMGKKPEKSMTKVLNDVLASMEKKKE